MMEETKRCIYTRLDNGIHELTFYESSRMAVDEMVSHMSNILKTTPEDAPATCYMVDNSKADVIPINYLRIGIKDLSAQRPSNREPGRLAVIYDGAMGGLVNTVLTLAMKNKFRFFKPEKRDEAIAWLLQG
jgi:hypothetical protein